MARKQRTKAALLISAAAAIAAAGGCVLYMRSARKRKRIGSLAELHQAVTSAGVSRYLYSHEYIIRMEKTDEHEDDLTELPISQIKQLSNVLELGLPGHHIALLEPQACQLTSLRSLDLSGNKLTGLPAEISTLHSLEDFNLGRNCIVSLPAQLGSLRKLRFLNLMSNHLVSLPPDICQLSALYRLGLKGNQLTHLPDNFGGLSGLVELFITDNALEALPESLGQCTNLVKLQASFNKLRKLPASIGGLPKLELLRVACNCLEEVPEELARCQSLAWESLAGNPCCAKPSPPRHEIQHIAADALGMGASLGEGASGDVFAADMDGKAVAVKLFKGEVSPDGRAADEIDVTCAVNHPNLTKVVAIIKEPHALVLERVEGLPLAQKPNLQVLLRCRWAPGLEFRAAWIAGVAHGIASALAYLHAHHICHGDVYAHNILVGDSAKPTLLDYGASFFYEPGEISYEAQEARAFGLFLTDLLARMDPCDQKSMASTALQGIRAACLQPNPRERPPFQQIASHCHSILEVQSTEGPQVLASPTRLKLPVA